jgi:hypothetical protein
MSKSTNHKGKMSHCKKERKDRSEYWKCGKTSGGCGKFKKKK